MSTAKTTHKPTRPTEDEVSAAESVLRRDYYADVAFAAESLMVIASDRDSFFRALSGMTCTQSGHQRVIYTGKAMKGVLFSTQDADLALQQGVINLSHCNELPWEGLMSCIFERDILEKLDELGVDVNDDDTFGKGE